jgi:hypothetical protein
VPPPPILRIADATGNGGKGHSIKRPSPVTRTTLPTNRRTIPLPPDVKKPSFGFGIAVGVAETGVETAGEADAVDGKAILLFGKRDGPSKTPSMKANRREHNSTKIRIKTG